MTIKEALEELQNELAEAGVSGRVEVEVPVIYHQSSSGVEVECVHSRSRRSEHVHKVTIPLEISEASKKPAPKNEVPESHQPLEKLKEMKKSLSSVGRSPREEPKAKKLTPPPLRYGHDRI